MMKQLITLFLAVFLTSVSWSQQAEDAGDTDAEASETSDATVEEDDSDLDDQGYDAKDEDDFVPTEEVSADQSLPFPVDI